MKTGLVTLLLSSQFVQAISVANYSDATNDRFTDSPSFIGAAHDFSGVGRSTDTSSTRWATLIGPNYFISANHFHPAVGSTISFTAGNNPGDPTYTYTVSGGFTVTGTDFWIGYTEAAMHPSLARYGYSTIPANTLQETGLAGADLFMMGDRISGQPGAAMAQTVGTNQGESFRNTGTTAMNTPQTTVNFGDPAAFDQIVTFENIAGDNTLNMTTHESQVASGDSGSPLFSHGLSGLLLQGTAWAVSIGIPGNFVDTGIPGIAEPGDPLESRNASFYSYIGSYETAIGNTIAMVPAPVPEPSALLMPISCACLLLRRRR
ncbi:hypothetical protein HZ994_05850 [Akkermansiaceae bacterium]|nr:hypothetical protein HZ994_05850 [Akkermansiaceae bacterium]